MRRFGWLFMFAVTIGLLSIPSEAEAAGGLSITNIDLPSNTVEVQIITVGDGMGDVSVTVPGELSSIIVVRRAGAGACPGGPTVYTCSGDPGEIEVLYEASSLSSGLADNQALTVTAQSSGVTVSGTVTIRRGTDLYIVSGRFTTISEGSAYLQVLVGNHGPDRASGVQVFVDGVDPRVWVGGGGSCGRSGARIVCSLAQVPTIGAVVLVNLTRCAVTSPVTVSVSTTTTETNAGNNSASVPGLSDGSQTCDQVFANQVPGNPPGGGSGSGSGTGTGSGSGGGTGSGSGAGPIEMPTSSAGTPATSGPASSTLDINEQGATDVASAAGDRPGGSTTLILLAGLVTLALAADAVAWLRLRRSTGPTSAPPGSA